MTTDTARRRGALVAVPVLALTVAMSSPASADDARVPLPSPNVPGLTGTIVPIDPTQQISLRVYLADRPGLAGAATAVSDPRGPGYAHYLSPAQVQQHYAPTATQSSAVSAWLTAQGMTITSTASRYFTVTATVAQADAAFDTQIIDYNTTVTEKGGPPVTISSAGVTGGFSVPAALGGDILSVTGIEQIGQPTVTSSAADAVRGRTVSATRSRTAKAKAKTAPAATAASFQCSQYWGQYTTSIPAAYGHTTAPTQLCGYTPDQVRSAYGIAGSPSTGKGATVAILLDDFLPTMEADADRFFTSHGLAGFAPGQYTQIVSPSVVSTCTAATGGSDSGDPEPPIDVESTHLAAPDARVVYVAADCAENVGDFFATHYDAARQVVDQHLADVVTGSWGIGEAGISAADTAPWEPVFQEGALEGIGFDFSSGDAGDVFGDPADPTAYNVHNVQFPATDPWVTAVGGTSASIGADGSVVADYPWGDNVAQYDSTNTGYQQAPPGTFQVGSGGGVSTMFAQPSYQRRVVPGGLATGNGTAAAARVIPDISADAGNPWLIGFTGANDPGVYAEIAGAGGTSASSPLMAGLEADAMQAAGHPLGFVNPLLYCMNGSSAVRDILPVNPADPPIAAGWQLETEILPDYLTVFGEDATLTTTPGYDDTTGMGAPTPSFVAELGGAARR